MVNELFDVTVDDFDVVVEVFAEMTNVFDIGVVDVMRIGAPFGAGAPLTTRGLNSIQRPEMVTAVKRFMVAEVAFIGKDPIWWRILLLLWKKHGSFSKASGLF